MNMKDYLWEELWNSDSRILPVLLNFTQLKLFQRGFTKFHIGIRVLILVSGNLDFGVLLHHPILPPTLCNGFDQDLVVNREKRESGAHPKSERSDGARLALPDVAHKIAVVLGDVALHTERVVAVQLQ